MAKTYATICLLVIFGCLFAVSPKQKPATASPAVVDQSAIIDAVKADNAALAAQVAELTESLRVASEAIHAAPLVADDAGAPSPAAFVAVAPAANCPGGVCYAPPRSQPSGGRYRQPANGPLRYRVYRQQPERRAILPWRR